MVTNPRKLKHFTAVAAAVGGCLLLSVISCVPAARTLSAREAAELARKVESANQSADAAYAAQVNAWRAHLQSARSPEQLTEFVERLLSFEQKYYQSTAFLRSESDEQRVRALFREIVLDDRQLVPAMHSAVEQYEQFLFEQERPLLEAAGVSVDDWSRQLQAARPTTPNWSEALEPAMAQAVHEAREDAARLVSSCVVGDLAGDGIKSMARSTGFDTTEEGSLADWVTGLVIDLAADEVIDSLMDGTEEIVGRVGQKMAHAESSLLAGEQGLFTVLHQLKSAHVSARNSLVTTAQAR